MLAKIQRKLSISEISVYFKNLIWILYPFYNNIFCILLLSHYSILTADHTCNLYSSFPIWPHTRLCILTCLSTVVLVQPHTDLEWFTEPAEKNLDFYFCSVKPTMKLCPYTEKNAKVPDAEVLPFQNKNVYYGDLLLHTFPKEFTSYM